jgi:hypothetical protein
MLSSVNNKRSVYDTFALFWLDNLRVSTLAEKKIYGTKDDTLTGSRFTRNYRETGKEFDVEFINKSIILYI